MTEQDLKDMIIEHTSHLGPTPQDADARSIIFSHKKAVPTLLVSARVITGQREFSTIIEGPAVETEREALEALLGEVMSTFQVAYRDSREEAEGGEVGL